MPAHLLNDTLIGPASRYVQKAQEESLAASTEELAGLRFSLLLTVKWEASGIESPDRREELRSEISELRNHYFDKLDEIAMNFGISAAVKAKEHVERAVTLPSGMKLPAEPGEEGYPFL